MKLKVSKFRMKIYHRSTEIVTYTRQSHRQIKARRWNAGAATNPMENPLNNLNSMSKKADGINYLGKIFSSNYSNAS